MSQCAHLDKHLSSYMKDMSARGKPRCRQHGKGISTGADSSMCPALQIHTSNHDDAQSSNNHGSLKPQVHNGRPRRSLQHRPHQTGSLAQLLLPLLVLVAALTPMQRASAATKWTFLVYMVADNDLECYALMDMAEMMVGLAQEPATGCVSTACSAGPSCPAGLIQTRKFSCSGGFQLRCCPQDAYPDVLALLDRGASACSDIKATGIDLTVINSAWTTARELAVLPGEGRR